MSNNGRRTVLLAILLLALGMSVSAQAIYTSLGDGATVNANLYTNKSDVYLNGGPQNSSGGSGLPDGVYVFEVTNPSTSQLLSTDAAACRKVVVKKGVIYGTPQSNAPDYDADADACQHVVGTLNPANGSIPVQLMPFDNTPNQGGVYKVTLFTPSEKSDNFKILIPGQDAPTQATLSGVKFNDLNFNGVKDDGEPGIPGWTINLTLDGGAVIPLTTGADGTYSYGPVEILATPSQYSICEVQRSGWVKSYPAFDCHEGSLIADISGLDFGNYQTIDLSGMKFYDKNGNGAKDAGEAPIAIWGITVQVWRDAVDGTDLFATHNLTTDDSGAFSTGIPALSYYKICEVQQTGYTQSMPAGGACYSGQAGTTNITGKDFGNYIKISGMKWYDLDKDGIKDVGEDAVPGIHIIAANCTDATCVTEVSGTTVQTSSGANGTWGLILAAPTTYYKVHEILPPGSLGVQWTQTSTPIVYIGQVGVTGATSLDFGNVCLLTGNGTIGFWGNKNGNAVLGANSGWMTTLSALNLRNGDGNHFYPANISGWNTYLKNATAVNMAYMLSAQMAATQLNVLRNSSGATTMVWNGSDWVTVNDAIGIANSLLSDDTCTTSCVVGSGNMLRSPMETWKNLFDTINNNQAVVQFGSGGCTVTYP